MRVEQLRENMIKGQKKTFWLGGSIYPSGFLTSILQTTARKANISIDSLKWEFDFYNNESTIPSVRSGVLLRDIFIEGAKWNKIQQTIEDQNPMTLYEQMPIIHLKPVEKVTNLKQKMQYYSCPVYSYTGRKDQ